MVLSGARMRFDKLRTRGCGGNGEPYYGITGRALGTQCQVMFSAPGYAAADDFRVDVADWLHRFEAKYSRFLPESMISEINRNAGVKAVAIDEELAGILRLCDWYHWLTQGVFDPTLLPVEELWDHRRERPTVPSEELIVEALNRVGWGNVEWDDDEVFLPRGGMQIDVGGIGKEFAVDKVVEKGCSRGFRNMLVDFGRDIRAFGSAPNGGPWLIGLEEASDPSRCCAGIGLSRHAVATSGNYARYFEYDGNRYGHIIDPRTGRPADTDVLSASVIAPTCTEAGVLSTSCVVLGSDDGMAFMNSFSQAEGLVQARDAVLRTRGFGRHELREAGVA